MIFQRAVNVCLCFLVFAIANSARADRTFEWSGNDPRFSGAFSISDADFEKRSFQSITAARYEFRDSLSPALNVVLDNPSGFHPGNMRGDISPDGTRLAGNFWIAVWQPPGIEVGMYGHKNPTGGELFTYANYARGSVIDSQGTWTLQVPEPTISAFLAIGISLTCLRHFSKPRKA